MLEVAPNGSIQEGSTDKWYRTDPPHAPTHHPPTAASDQPTNPRPAANNLLELVSKPPDKGSPAAIAAILRLEARPINPWKPSRVDGFEPNHREAETADHDPLRDTNLA